MMAPKAERLLPKHLGLILDGNRRWAAEQNLPAAKGHYEGAEVLRDIAIAAVNSGVKYLSAYVFSTENWKRSKTEVNLLMRLIIRFSEKYLDELMANDIRLIHVGSREGLPRSVLSAIDKAARKSQHCKKGVLALCINYGGQQEIVDAAKELLKRKANPRHLDIREFESALYAPSLPPLDLVIRTSGEQRTSGFMLWRSAYAEYIFVDKYWPAFDRQDLKAALLEFARRQRRFGA